MGEKWPCPCCGHLTLTEGPGDYDLCPVCFWEDDDTQLRWPLSDDGANGISLVEAQRNYRLFGAGHKEERRKVRRPRADEPLDDGWRPIDLRVDNVERDPHSPDRLPWPADATRLYWWRPTYYARPNAQTTEAVVPTGQDRAPTPAEQLMARVLEKAPEARPVDEQVRRDYESPAPFVFCTLLADLAIDAFKSDNDELAQRLLGALNTGLTDGDPIAYNCVSIAFLENERWHDPALRPFIAGWPSEIRVEITRQLEHVAAAQLEAARYASSCGPIHDALADLGRTHRGRPLVEAIPALRRALASERVDLPDVVLAELAARTVQPGWPFRHPIRWLRTRHLRWGRFAG